ncbi:hypothetical protein [Corynebacterium variabile]|uniref:Uncharacterized protein n=1 Tax=Corynebacterium variabile TaxID=1727 RepID=A0A4Y4C3L1_9CORY|nr:hypothetical protein [Corynebacterium variabile]GEC85653.1 hypothetical protein CVA01_09670 [Corynebacterium variabile]
MTSSAGKITVFSVHPAPAILLAIVVREPAVQLIVVVVLLFVVWAAFGLRLTVSVGQETVDVVGTFYRRSIPAGQIDSVTVAPDDGMNHVLLNWQVTGRATSLDGVRLNLGGSVALQIRTMAGERYNVVFPTNADALACRDAAIEVVGQPPQSAV